MAEKLMTVRITMTNGEVHVLEPSTRKTALAITNSETEWVFFTDRFDNEVWLKNSEIVSVECGEWKPRIR